MIVSYVAAEELSEDKLSYLPSEGMVRYCSAFNHAVGGYHQDRGGSRLHRPIPIVVHSSPVIFEVVDLALQKIPL
jgi:hypothetical protein